MDCAECAPGHELTWKAFARLVGAPKSTIQDWTSEGVPEQITRFLCGIERLSEPRRVELLRSLCRDCPRLEHPRLAHDQTSVAAFRTALGQPAGLTFIIGPTDELRTFLITAAGNSAAALAPSRQVCGLDVHRPDGWVPVPGVVYFQDPTDTAQIRGCIQAIWAAVENSAASLVLINGVWSVAPEMRQRIISCAEKRHVLIADDSASTVPTQRSFRGLLRNIVTVVPDTGPRLRLLVQTAGPYR